VGLTNVWVRTLSDGLIRADHIMGLTPTAPTAGGKARSLAAGRYPAGSSG
jgi:hypothetical protein